MTPVDQLAPARALAERLPKLLLAAEQLAFAAAPGLHGRRRGGQGDSFWQFRDWQNGEDAKRIDWRRSALGDRFYYREREWEVPASITLILENTPGLDFQSASFLPSKRDRATLLLLATAAILLRAGERVSAAGATPPLTGLSSLSRLAAALTSSRQTETDQNGRQIRFGDFLDPARSFAVNPGGAIVQILDPAECDFPFEGRMVFEGNSTEQPVCASNAATWRQAYMARMAAHRAAIAQAALRAGQTPLFHRTDHAPATLVAALYQALRKA